MHRVASNHTALHRGTTWGSGWAIGGWFAPPFVYVIPMLVLGEMWKASDPEVPVGGDWKRGASSPLIPVWFVTYSLIPLVLLIVGFDDMFGGLGGDQAEQLAEQLTGDMLTSVVGAAANIVSAVVFLVIVRTITARHRRLTGEAAR